MTNRPNTLKAELDGFLQAIYRGNLDTMPEDQRVHITQAFYAGAQVMLCLNSQAANFCDDTGVEILQSYYDEIRAYFLSKETSRKTNTTQVAH
jgi:hypothetical protein